MQVNLNLELLGFHQQNQWLIYVFLTVGGVVAGYKLFRFLRGRMGLGGRIFEAVDEALSWLPGYSRIEDHKRADAERKVFLERRKNRKPGQITDEM
ncbi:MAG: hypothetical protein AAGC58_10075 [Asticcacaulis sp.]